MATILKKTQVYFLLAVVQLIWLLDAMTGRVFELVVVLSSKAFSAVFSLGLIFFIAYSIKTSYMYQVGIGVLAHMFYFDSQVSYSNVLGAANRYKEKPKPIADIEFPEISAKAFLIADRGNKKILKDKNSTQRLASASTTKLMTALVALDVYTPEEEVSVSQKCADIEGTKIGLSADTKYHASDMLQAMLVGSAADAACALSESKTELDEFLYLMNQKAYNLNIKSSYFTNPVGLDGENNSHFSTAQDLYKLAVAATDENLIRQAVKAKEYLIKSTDEKFIGKVENTNKLLFEIPQSIGIKTGTTSEAGQVLIYEFKDAQKDLVIIVMGSEDRFTDTRALLNWALLSYSWD